MLRFLVPVLAATFFFVQPALADDHEDADFAQYAAFVGVSPFGGSVNLAYNFSRQNSLNVAFGGLPGGLLSMDVELDGTDYEAEGSSSWVGAFINHRPSKESQWFRVVAGIGIGSIENELDDGNGNTFTADYNENPVGYLGVGFGNEATKGFKIGFDIGILATSGPDIIQTGGMPNQAAADDLADNMFFGSLLPNFQLTFGYGF